MSTKTPSYYNSMSPFQESSGYVSRTSRRRPRRQLEQHTPSYSATKPMLALMLLMHHSTAHALISPSVDIMGSLGSARCGNIARLSSISRQWDARGSDRRGVVAMRSTLPRPTQRQTPAAPELETQPKGGGGTSVREMSAQMKQVRFFASREDRSRMRKSVQKQQTFSR